VIMQSDIYNAHAPRCLVVYNRNVRALQLQAHEVHDTYRESSVDAPLAS